MRTDAATELKIIEDSNGFLKLSGVIATAGEKLRYITDGNVIEETVTEAALFGNSSDLNGAPFTNEHPSSLITPENAASLTKGAVITPRRDGDQLWVDIKATDKKTIQDIRDGKRGLSAGYTCDVDSDGNQISRNYNHVALCVVGRSPSSGIRSDERRDSYDINEEKKMPSIKFPGGKEIKLDCSDAEAELVQSQIDAMQEKFDMSEEEGKEKLSKMKADMEQMKKDGKDIEKLQAQYDALKEEMEKSKGKMDSNELSDIFDTHEKVLKLNPEIKIRKDSGEIKTSRELAEEAMSEVKFDEKSDDYVMARLDSTIEFSQDSNLQKQRGTNQRNDSKYSLTVQQKADQAFYNGKEK